MPYSTKYNASWALVIGVNDYRFAPRLEIARADAEAICAILSESLGFPKANVTALVDAKATRARIMEKFLSYDALHPDDRLLVFFAGHGTTVESLRGPVGYLVPADGRLAKKDSLIRWNELTHNADMIPAKHILFVMDACYSGLAIQRTAPAGEQRFLSDMLTRRSRQVITAGKADEAVADGGGPTGKNSLFTGHLIEGMKGSAATGGIMTASDLMSYAVRKVGTDPRSQQTPHFGHVDGDGEFILQSPNDVHLQGTSGDDYLVKTVASQPEPPAIVDWKSPIANFAAKNGYEDPESPSFGKNEWSSKLGAFAHQSGTVICQRAFGWLSLVAEPVVDEPLLVDLPTLAKSLPKDAGNLEDESRFAYPSRAITTANSLVLFEHDYLPGASAGDCWPRFVRVEKSGAVEYCEYRHVARHINVNEEDGESGTPVFLYVQIIGTIWVFLMALKRLFSSIGHVGGVRFYVNVVGTKGSVLVDFAYGEGKDRQSWLDPFNPGMFGVGDFFSRLRCRDANLNFPFKCVIGSLDEAEITKIIRSCASQFGLAYNHQSEPRCFVYGTQDFPWSQFEGRRR